MKGIGFAAVMWIVHVIVIPIMVAPRPFIFRTFNETIVDIVNHIVWGGIAALFIANNIKLPIEDPPCWKRAIKFTVKKAQPSDIS